METTNDVVEVRVVDYPQQHPQMVDAGAANLLPALFGIVVFYSTDVQIHRKGVLGSSENDLARAIHFNAIRCWSFKKSHTNSW